jgi:hypothetical protein
MMPRGLVEVYQCFRAAYHLHLQDQSVNETKGLACHLLLAGCLLCLFFNPEDGGRMFL